MKLVNRLPKPHLYETARQRGLRSTRIRVKNIPGFQKCLKWARVLHKMITIKICFVFLALKCLKNPDISGLLSLHQFISSSVHLFVGHVEEQIFQQYPGKKPDLYKRYIDDIAGAASCSKNELDNFAEFINNFHPSLKFTWAISDNQLPFLDLLLKPIPKD